MSYLSSITLPGFFFENRAAAILLPVIAGGAIGYSTSRTLPNHILYPCSRPTDQLSYSHKRNPKHLPLASQASLPPPCMAVWSSLDNPLRPHGLHSAPFLHHRYLLTQPRHRRSRKIRCLALHTPTRPEPPLDAPVLWAEQANLGDGRYRCFGRDGRVYGAYVRAGG
jgi:hypothetical protein